MSTSQMILKQFPDESKMSHLKTEAINYQQIKEEIHLFNYQKKNHITIKKKVKRERTDGGKFL